MTQCLCFSYMHIYMALSFPLGRFGCDAGSWLESHIDVWQLSTLKQHKKEK